MGDSGGCDCENPDNDFEEDNVEGCREHIELEVDYAQGKHLVNLYGPGMRDTGVPRAAKTAPFSPLAKMLTLPLCAPLAKNGMMVL